jgi:multidrug resistance protein, MATE family
LKEGLEAEPPGAEATTAPSAADDPKALQRRVLRLAGPVIGENLLETMLGIVDTLLVAGLGAAAIAGVGTGQQMTFFLLAVLSALSVGNSVLVAQAVGAGRLEQAGVLARQSLVWSVLLSVPLAILGVAFAKPLVALFGVPGDVAHVASGYFRVTMGTVVVVIALVIGGGVLRGAGDSKTPMVVTAIANVVNAALA